MENKRLDIPLYIVSVVFQEDTWTAQIDYGRKFGRILTRNTKSPSLDWIEQAENGEIRFLPNDPVSKALRERINLKLKKQFKPVEDEPPF